MRAYEKNSAMKREDWSDLATFAAIADTGSFTKVAQNLGISPSALSHTIRALENRLGVRLLNRTTRSVAPTEAGESLLLSLRPAMGDVANALDHLSEQRDKPAGRLRISAHRSAAMQSIMPRMAKFAEAYPDIVVDLSINDGLVDIVARALTLACATNICWTRT
jgi:DNA-binding transcriptional LysR family regulator